MLNSLKLERLAKPLRRRAGLFSAVRDIVLALQQLPLIVMLAWQDLKQRYRRSFIGPFWLTINMSVMIASIGLVFSQILHTPLQEFLPFLSVGMILWGFITTILTEGCHCFTASESLIKQLSLPLFVHTLRLLCRNVFIFFHHLGIFPLVCWAVGAPMSVMPFITLLGFLLLMSNLLWMSLLLAIICTRYRDLPQIITNFLQVIFYLTPIIWQPTLLPERMAFYFLDSNPFYHLIEIVRAPLLGEMPSALNLTATVGMLLVGWLGTLLVYGRYRRMIVYWI